MAVVAMLYGVVSQHSIWYPINLLVAGFFPRAVTADTTAEIAAFHLSALPDRHSDSPDHVGAGRVALRRHAADASAAADSAGRFHRACPVDGPDSQHSRNREPGAQPAYRLGLVCGCHKWHLELSRAWSFPGRDESAPGSNCRWRCAGHGRFRNERGRKDERNEASVIHLAAWIAGVGCLPRRPAAFATVPRAVQRQIRSRSRRTRSWTSVPLCEELRRMSRTGWKGRRCDRTWKPDLSRHRRRCDDSSRNRRRRSRNLHAGVCAALRRNVDRRPDQRHRRRNSNPLG